MWQKGLVSYWKRFRKMNKDFNIILSGVGGQGIITLLSLIDEAAFIEDYNVKSSEIHGLSQRGGSVEAHVRFGEKINSPLVSNGEANLIISLEILEALRSASMAGKQTQFLINDFMSPFIFSYEWMTVVWSRPPNFSPIEGYEMPMSSLKRYIII